MTIQQLRYFRDTAEVLNFTKVANSLHISQPNLSHAIFSLEQELGFQLFVRQRGRQTVLTDDGKAFYQYVKSALDILDGGIQAIQQSNEMRAKTIRIAYSHVYGLVIVPTIVGAFKNQFPKGESPSVQFNVIQSKADFLEMVHSGEVDAAFSFAEGTSTISATPVSSIELKVMVSGQNILSKKTAITIEDIAEEPLICCDQEPYLHEHILRMFKAHGLKPNIREIFPDWGPQFAAVSYGSGVAITPVFPMATDRIIVKTLDDPMSRVSYNMLYNESDFAGNRTARKLLQTANTYAKEHL